MSRIRSTLKQSPAIVIALTALTFSLGGGAGYAASTAARPAIATATKVHWAKLKLINGWKSGQNYLKADRVNTGAPAYAVVNGVVYLSGSIDSTNSSIYGRPFAVLPRGARPTHTLSIAAVGEPFATGDTDTGNVAVSPKGVLYTDMLSSDNLSFTFLSGVSFALGS
jgi:hypothetical protein